MLHRQAGRPGQGGYHIQLLLHSHAGVQAGRALRSVLPCPRRPCAHRRGPASCLGVFVAERMNVSWVEVWVVDRVGEGGAGQDVRSVLPGSGEFPN